MSEARCPIHSEFQPLVEYTPEPLTVELPARNGELLAGMDEVKAKLLVWDLPPTFEQFTVETLNYLDLGQLEPGDPRLKIPRHIICTALHEMQGYFTMVGSGESACLVRFDVRRVIEAPAPFAAFGQEIARCFKLGWRDMRESQLGEKAATLLAWQQEMGKIDPSTSETWMPLDEDGMRPGAESGDEVACFFTKSGLMIINYEDTYHTKLDWTEVNRDLKHDDRKRARNSLMAVFRGPLMRYSLPYDKFELSKRSPNGRWTEDGKGFTRQPADYKGLFPLICPAEMALSWDGTQTLLEQLYDAAINVAPECGLFDRAIVLEAWQKFLQIREELPREIDQLRIENWHLRPFKLERIIEAHIATRFGKVL